MRLEARDISFKYGKGTRQILDHVNLTVEPGESVGIMAPSGYGKTTLCKILAGYERPDSGEVLVDGMPVFELRGYCPVQMVWQLRVWKIWLRLRKVRLWEREGTPEQ